MRLLCVSTQRNEGPFLLEWIAHMLGAGVSDLLIYSNDCSDGSDGLLDLLADAGVLTHVRHNAPDGDSIQWQALRAAWKHPLRKAADWAIVCDIDEFPVIHTGNGTFADLLAALPEGTDAITLSWRLFGSNGVARLVDAPVTQQFRHANPADAQWPVGATFFKTLFRVKGPFNQFGVHRPKQKAAHKTGLPHWVDGSGGAMPAAFAERVQRLSLFGLPNGRDLVELNHYSLRSAESFLLKRDRGLPNRSEKSIDLAYWAERNFNEVPAHAIDTMRPATVAAYDRLMALPGVAEAHSAAITWHQSRFVDLVTTQEGHRLFSQLLLSRSSVTPDAQTAKALVAWYQVAHKRKLITAD